MPAEGVIQEEAHTLHVSRILIAVDFSDAGRVALAAGIQLARDLQQDVLLVHAFPEPMKAPVAAGMGYHEVFQRFASEHEADEAIRLTTEFADQARDAGLDVEVVAEARDPAALILATEKRKDVAMVVVGTHGKSGFKKFILGSVAADVVSKSTTPVLVVPMPA